MSAIALRCEYPPGRNRQGSAKVGWWFEPIRGLFGPVLGSYSLPLPLEGNIATRRPRQP